MSIKNYKPYTPSRRTMSTTDFSTLTKKRPEKSLTKYKKQKAGRARTGTVTIRHRGGGNKRKHREIDFKQQDYDITAIVKAVEYDPNRSAFIALLTYSNGKKSYIIATKKMKVGDEIVSSRKKIEIKNGNRTILKHMPLGTEIHNVEIEVGRGAVRARSAGTYATVVAHDGEYTQIKFPSGEVRNVNSECSATIGTVSRGDHNNIVIGKAGRKRWQSKRPTVRGKAMNPVDHPHGGGEGRSPIGLRRPKTKWGKPALGVPSRKQVKFSDRFIIKPRKNRKK
ncbi:MAG: 50S ribosomal protein L2 [bacterium]